MAKVISNIETADEARQIAIDWQIEASEKSYSYAELAGWSDYFTDMAKKFNLTKEFKENGII